MIALGPKRVVMSGRGPLETSAALARDVHPGALFALDRPGSDARPLRGWVRGETFAVVRRSQFRNSFTPVVEGLISASENGGSRLELRLGMHVLPFVTVAAWIVAVGTLAVLAADAGALGEMGLALAGIGLLGPALAALLYRAEIDAVVQDVTVAVTRPG